ncbi:MAG: hypothetical protein CMF55_05975 [Legionellales bacterium]|nr:hypothetical protein [Legionellales bacterium]
MSTHQKLKTSLCRQILRHQGKLIRHNPSIVICPIIEALISWGLILLVAHPFINHYQQSDNLDISLSLPTLIKITVFLISYHCLKHLIQAFSISTTILQLKPVIIDHKKPLDILTALRKSIANWKSITSWILFLTFFSNLCRLFKPLLNKWKYLKRFLSGSDHLATSLLILPCLLTEKISTREAYRKMGESIQKTWGNNRKLNLGFFALGLSLLGLSILPIAGYFLLGLHEHTILIACISLSILSAIAVKITSTITTSILLTHLHHYATTQKRARNDIEIERALVECIKTKHHDGVKSRHPDELKFNAA